MYKKYYSLGVSVLKRDAASIKQVAEDSKLLKPAIVIYALPNVLNLLLGALIFPSGFGAIFSRFLTWSIFIPPLALLGGFFVVFLLLTQYYKVKVSFEAIFRVMGIASIVVFLTVVPYVLAVFGLIDPFDLFGLFWLVAGAWMMLVLHAYLKSLHGLDKNKVLISIAVTVLAFFLLDRILGNLFIGSAYNLF